MRIRRRELAGEFAERVCSRERLPYTLAIHRGGANGENPHAHLMPFPVAPYRLSA